MNTSVRSTLTDRANGARTSMTHPALLLRLEGATLLAAAVLLYREHDAPWLLIAVLLFAPDLDPLDATLLRASLGPLAVEAAPVRVNAILAHPGADPGAVEAAALFLEAARSTTGQLLEVTA